MPWCIFFLWPLDRWSSQDRWQLNSVLEPFAWPAGRRWICFQSPKRLHRWKLWVVQAHLRSCPRLESGISPACCPGGQIWWPWCPDRRNNQKKKFFLLSTTLSQVVEAKTNVTGILFYFRYWPKRLVPSMQRRELTTMGPDIFLINAHSPYISCCILTWARCDIIQKFYNGAERKISGKVPDISACLQAATDTDTTSTCFFSDSSSPFHNAYGSRHSCTTTSTGSKVSHTAGIWAFPARLWSNGIFAWRRGQRLKQGD